MLCKSYRTSVLPGVMCVAVRTIRPLEDTTVMRRVKLALIPVAVAAVELFGASAAHGYFRIK
jgi:hypothetical protein